MSAAPSPTAATSTSSNGQAPMIVASGGNGVKRKPDDSVNAPKPPTPSPSSSSTTAAPGAPAAASAASAGAAAQKGQPVTKKAKTNDGKAATADSSSSDDSSSSSDSDSDEDQPLLAKVKAKAAPKQTTAAAATKASTPSSTTTTTPTPTASSAAAAAAEKKTEKKVADESSSSDSSSSSSDDSSDSSESEPDEKKVKKPPAKKKAAAPKKAAAKKKAAKKKKSDSSDDSSDSDSDSDAPKKKKKGEKKGASTHAQLLQDASKYQQRAEIIPLQPTQGANKWWNRKIEKNVKWETLEHNGVLFPPPYEPHGVPVLYEGKSVKLQPDAEEIATFYASMLESDHVKGAVFNKNFWNDWKKVLDENSSNPIQSLEKVDFRPIFDHLQKKRDETKEERKLPAVKKKLKEEKDKLMQTYGIAIVDGFKEKVGNFRVEPPSLFRGRGKHPKTGCVKRRLVPEDVTINIGKNVPIPKCPDGHKWKGILHNNKVTWLAYWKDTVTKKDFKYVFLAAASRFKGESDMKKYTKAQKLKTMIDHIRTNYKREMNGKTTVERQRATAIYLIDVLALRIGNEKDKDTQADTVGCTSLRVEHIEFKENNYIVLDFLGKDSMRYLNEVQVHPQVWTNLNDFVKDKSKEEKIFDRVTPTELNAHLKELMPGLSAKVFRTYNASITLQTELAKEEDDIDVSELVPVKVAHYNKANRTVAILCNHQRSVPKGHEDGMKKLQEQLQKEKDKKEDLEDYLAELTGKGKKKRSKKEKKESGDQSPKRRSTDPSKIKEQIANSEKKVRSYEAKMRTKDEGKTVALGTSKINYMDPRITVAWCKRKQVPIEKIFGRSLLEKFPWAMEVPQDWEF